MHRRPLSRLALACCLLALFAAAAAAAGFGSASLTSLLLPDGATRYPQYQAGRLLHLDGVGLLPASGTATISRVVGTYTQTVCRAACTSGAFRVTLPDDWYFRNADYFYRSGATSGTVRAFLTL